MALAWAPEREGSWRIWSQAPRRSSTLRPFATPVSLTVRSPGPQQAYDRSPAVDAIEDARHIGEPLRFPVECFTLSEAPDPIRGRSSTPCIGRTGQCLTRRSAIALGREIVKRAANIVESRPT